MCRGARPRRIRSPEGRRRVLRGACLLAATVPVAALGLPVTATAQETEAEQGDAGSRRDVIAGRAIRHGSSMEARDVASVCADIPRPTPPVGEADTTRSGEACDVVQSGQLPTLGEERWLWALYEHATEPSQALDVPPGDREQLPERLPEQELVLFVGPAGGERVRPVWHDRVETWFHLLRPPRAVTLDSEPVKASRALLAHRRCLSGTGGCLDHPFLLESGSVIPLRPRYREQALERLPDGWGPWKGIWLDPERRIAEAGVHMPGDANCCPSFELTARLEVRGDTLTADSISLEPVAGAETWRIRPGEAFGFVDARTSEASLREMVGPSMVSNAEVGAAEGVCTPGTLAFPGLPSEIEVAWADSARRRPAFVRTAATDGPWRTPRGIRIGSTLAELESLAGEPLSFSGFGWDHGGVLAWGEGPEPLLLRLEIDRDFDPRLGEIEAETPELAAEIMGDRTVRSDHPVIREITVTVLEMAQHWDATYLQRDCEPRPTD